MNNTILNRNSQGKWDDFYDYLIRQLDNIRFELKALLSLHKRRLKIGRITQEEYDQLLKNGTLRIQRITKDNKDILEFIEEKDGVYIFKLTKKYKNILREIISDDSNFWLDNPQFKQYPLLKKLVKVKKLLGTPLFDGIYDKEDENETVKLAHIDENYETLSVSSEYLWLLTVTESGGKEILNSGTEYIKLPILRLYALEEINRTSLNISLNDLIPYTMKLDTTVSGSAKTLHGMIFSCLTGLYADQYGKDWLLIQPNVLHNVASCYFHRSPRLLVEGSFRREHWATDETKDLREMIDTLK